MLEYASCGPAAALYTHHMYQHIASFQRTGGRKSNPRIVIAKNGVSFSSSRSGCRSGAG